MAIGVQRMAQRNAIILAVAQALYGAVTTAVVVTAGLVGAQLSSDPAWATMPMSTRRGLAIARSGRQRQPEACHT